MTTISVRNVHEALPTTAFLMLEHATMETSRNGPVAVFPNPVSIAYGRPWERVLYWHERDANPYMHFFEALWMLAGRDDVEFPATYAKQLRAYSDDGKTLHGAYGRRWRTHFNLDQLEWAIRRLRSDANDRRVVISHWDANIDPAKANNDGKDVPCNTQLYLAIRNGQLCMQVLCRSNDLYWGCLGANAVHFAFLQEYVAQSLGVPIGWYFQTAFNLHWYDDFHQKVFNERSALTQETSLRHNMTLPTEHKWNPYASGELGERPTHPLMANTDHAAWDAQLAIFLAGGVAEGDGLTDPFFTEVAVPLRESHVAYREKHYTAAQELAASCAAPDWRKGCLDWLNRRAAERSTKSAEQNRVDAAG